LAQRGFVRGAYHAELIRFREGIYKPLFEKGDPRAQYKEIEFLETSLKNRAEHLRKSLEHISRGHRKQIIIFIDNCDQRDDDIQQNAFLIAQELAQNWPVTIFVSLRPETFHRSVRSGTLSGYHPKVFTISPPRIDEVIEKRLIFAQKIARGEIPLSSVKLSLQFPKLDILIEILKSSLKRNKNLLECIDNISGGNVRQAIDLVKAFLGSGHVDTEKILALNETNLFERQDPYLIPLHEFLRAVIYGDSVYYDPNRSPMTNLFDVHFYDRNEHFLLPILLGTLHSHLVTGKDNGFLDTNKVYGHLQSLGFTVDQIDASISFAYTRKLLETSERGAIIKPERPPSMLRINTIGIYHICNLCNLFTYIDAIVVDTPIFDSELKAKIKTGFDIKERLVKVEYFRQYLNEVWEYFRSKQTFFDWAQRSAELHLDIQEIESRVARKESYELF
jgi:hypothetical protein